MVLVRSWRPCENGGGTQSQTEYTASELIEEDMQILLMYGQFQSAVNRSAKSVLSVVVWFGLVYFCSSVRQCHYLERDAKWTSSFCTVSVLPVISSSLSLFLSAID